MTELRRLSAEVWTWDVLSHVFGPTYHPGGLDLTGRMAGLMRVPRGANVLDVASGPGGSARYLAEWFGYRVVGIDASPGNARRGRLAADGHAVAFLAADANRLPFRPRTFDAAMCECSLCLFGDARSAMQELVRSLKPGAKLGIADVTLAADAPLSPALRTGLAAVACLATARPLDQYRDAMEDAGVRVERVEDASWALGNLLASLRETARRAEPLGLGDVRVGPYTVRDLTDLLDEAVDLHRDGFLGYAVLIGTVAP